MTMPMPQCFHGPDEANRSPPSPRWTATTTETRATRPIVVWGMVAGTGTGVLDAHDEELTFRDCSGSPPQDKAAWRCVTATRWPAP